MDEVVHSDIVALGSTTGLFVVTTGIVWYTRRWFSRLAAVVVWGLVSFVLLQTLVGFWDLHWSPHARRSWRVMRNWHSIHVGMTRAEAVKIVGSPDDPDNRNEYVWSLFGDRGIRASVHFAVSENKNRISAADFRTPESNPIGLTLVMDPRYEGPASAVALVLLVIASLVPVRNRLPHYYPVLALEVAILGRGDNWYVTSTTCVIIAAAWLHHYFNGTSSISEM